MSEKISILFIDDNTISDEIEQIDRVLIRNGIETEYSLVHISDKKFRKTTTIEGTETTVLCKASIQKHITDNFMEKHFDIVACDFDFSDPFLDGYKILTWLINMAKQNNNKIRNAKFLFYSGNTRDLEKVAGSHVKRLLPLKIEKIVDRGNLSRELVALVSKIQSEFDLVKEFFKLFDEHEDKIFKSVYPDFKGYSFGQIRKEIEDETVHSSRFIKALIEQTFAHMVSLQEN